MYSERDGMSALDAVDGPHPQVSKCPNAASIDRPGTSAYGYKQTFSGPKSMSALPPKADIPRSTLDFRF